MRVAVLGAGTIARLVLKAWRRGDLPGIEIAGVAARPGSPRAAALAGELGVPSVAGLQALLGLKPEVVLEAAGHDAVREHLVALLEARTSVVVLSAGALVDDTLRAAAETAAKRSGSRLYVPSGGIGGLDVLKAACAGGVDEVSIQVAKPPAAWRGIAYLESRRVALEGLREPLTLFEGPAREGVPHFPQNVNIAAVLALAGVGLDKTRLRVVADPGLRDNTHTIRVSGATGRFTIILENMPAPENPKTSWLACYSAVAALRELAASARYGT
jgi:aspartate dehydrogenase